MSAEYNTQDIIRAEVSSGNKVLLEIREAMEVMASLDRDPGIYYRCSFIGHPEYSDAIVSQLDVVQWYPCQPARFTIPDVLPDNIEKTQEETLSIGGVLAVPTKKKVQRSVF